MITRIIVSMIMMYFGYDYNNHRDYDHCSNQLVFVFAVVSSCSGPYLNTWVLAQEFG